jgi:ferredoxin
MSAADGDILAGTDIEVIDSLCGHSLSDDLKGFLRSFYGPGGTRMRYWAEQDAERAKCRYAKAGYCNGCGICVPFCTDSLLDQLFTIVYCAEHGLFDVKCDSYESARQKIRIEPADLPPPDADCPF